MICGIPYIILEGTYEDYCKIKYKAENLKRTNNIHIPYIPYKWDMKKIKYIFQIKKDHDVLNNLPLVNDFYSALFSDPKAQQFPRLTKFFKILSPAFPLFSG